MPRLHISVLEFQEACLEFPLVAWPDIYEFGRQPLCQLSQKFDVVAVRRVERSEEHTSELQSLMRISYAVFCLKKKITTQNTYDISSTANRKQDRTKNYNNVRYSHNK